MIFACIIGGLAVTMNTWADRWSDIYLHLNDIYMISLMTCVMLFVMLFLESSAHHSDTNIWIYVFLGIIIFIFIRQQTFVNDTEYLQGMIPHHSMAITMSKNIAEKTKNPKIKALAQRISDTQRDEINEMKQILIEMETPGN